MGVTANLVTETDRALSAVLRHLRSAGPKRPIKVRDMTETWSGSNRRVYEAIDRLIEAGVCRRGGSGVGSFVVVEQWPISYELPARGGGAAE